MRGGAFAGGFVGERHVGGGGAHGGAVETDAGVDFFSVDDRFPEGAEVMALLRHRGKAAVAPTLGIAEPTAQP